jgi:membrane protein DedA with SNARE-associated domain
MASPEKIEKVGFYFERYGILTLIIGRFIPFGVRNAMSLTAGLSKMDFVKFALADLLACTISVATYFYLYYQYGEAVIDSIKEANIVIFVIALLAAAGYWVYRRQQK